ncbi:MAG: efflux RND transporter periplasmic adaptor subunit [Chloroflexota bacterium]
MRRVLVIVTLVILVAAAAFLVVRRRQAQQQQSLEILRSQTVERGRLSATVSATGSIEPEAFVSLTFGLAGTVQQVEVVRGQMVNEGDVLATLDAGELALAVQQAEDALRVQQLTLQQRQNSAPTPATLATAQADIDAAEASLLVAQANLEAAQAAVQQAQAQRAQLLAGATGAEIATAEAEVAARTAEMETVQDTYDQIIKVGLGGVVEEQTRFQLHATQLAVAAAQARLETLQAGPRPADMQAADASIAAARAQVSAAEGNVAVAEANVQRAQAAYDRLLEGPTEDELAILAAQVASAETNLAIAQLRLQQSMIVAPMSGRVASVVVQAGEQVAPGAPVVTLVNEGAFHLEVNVDEIDIEKVTVGQVVEITLDAIPERPLAGTVAEVAPTAASSQGGAGVVTYLVTINLTAADVPLRAGMTANATIVVDEVDGVLIVPNWAIRLDRESGQAFVNRQTAGGAIEEVVVETGLRNEQFSEVISGVNEGDVVVVTNEREGFSLFGN